MLYSNGCWNPTQLIEMNERLGNDIDFYLNVCPQNIPNRKAIYIDVFEPSRFNTPVEQIDACMDYITFAFTKSKYLLNKYPDKCYVAENILLGSDALDYDFSKPKEESVSFLLGRCYPTPMLQGYEQRLLFWINQHNIRFPKRFWVGNRSQPIEQTKENELPNDNKNLLYDSMFSVCIESSFEENYFTEKLKNCIYTKTIPIYMGCPNIQDYYDCEGILVVENFIEAIKTCDNLSSQLYETMLPKLLKNHSYVTVYPWKYIEEKLTEILRK